VGGHTLTAATLEDAFESETDYQTANFLKPVYSWYSFEKSLNSFKHVSLTRQTPLHQCGKHFTRGYYVKRQFKYTELMSTE